MEQGSRNGGFSLDLNWPPYNAGLVSSFSYEYWSNLHAQILNFHFQSFPYHFPGIYPNHPFPSTPFLGHHVDGGVMVFPGGHQLLPPYFQPMPHFPHITSVPPMIHGGYVPFFREQQQHPMNVPGMIGGGFWHPFHHHPAIAAAQHFHGYYGSHISGLMGNFAHMNIMEQELQHALGFGVEYMPYEAMLALQEQVGHVSTGLREEDISRNLGQSRYQMTEEECPEEKELCCICLDEFCDGDAIGKINCVHKFHYECIAEWLKCKNCCPSCRGEALSI